MLPDWYWKDDSASGKNRTDLKPHDAAAFFVLALMRKPKAAKRLTREVTAEVLAKRLGLSQSTVSRAFTDTASIHPETRELVIKEAHTLGYQPNILARSLITRRTNIVAVVMANLTDPFYPLVLDQLGQRAFSRAAGRCCCSLFRWERTSTMFCLHYFSTKSTQL
jgi:transcriptional regulator with XRE-family HTH domain